MYSQIVNINYDKNMKPKTDVRVGDLYVDGDIYYHGVIAPGITGPAGVTGPTGSGSGLDTLTQLGGSAEVGVGITGTELVLRTLRAGTAMSVVELADTVDFVNIAIQSTNNTQIFNYGQSRSFSLTPSYTSSGAITSNAIVPVEDSAGILTQTSLTNVDYVPGARQKDPVYAMFTTTATGGITSNSILKFYPNTEAAYDTTADYLLGCDTGAGRIWQINMSTLSEQFMEDYDAIPLPLVNVRFIAMDIADNILLYNLIADPWIRYYDFSTGNTQKFIDTTTIPSFGADVNGMCFNNETNVLYFVDSNTVVYMVPFTPFDRNLTPNPPYGLITKYNMSIALSIPTGFTVQDGTNVPFFVFTQGAGSLLAQTNPIGSLGVGGVIVDSNTVEGGFVNYSLCFGASGRLYLNSLATNTMYRFDYSSSVSSVPSVHFAPTVNTYSCLTRSPYGIKAA